MELWALALETYYGQHIYKAQNTINCCFEGKHYFYKNIDEDCKKHEPFAVFYDKGRLSGVALIAFGSTFNHPGAKFHFEDLNPPQKLKVCSLLLTGFNLGTIGGEGKRENTVNS